MSEKEISEENKGVIELSNNNQKEGDQEVSIEEDDGKNALEALNDIKEIIENNENLKNHPRMRKSILRLEQMSTFQEDNIQKIAQKQEQQQKMWDKLTFVRSMVFMILFFFLLGLDPARSFTYFYIFLTIYLLTKRFYMWIYKKWLLYYFEFCYYGNVLLVVYLWAYGNNRDVWLVTWVSCSGIMACAMVVFVNSVVFTSKEHMISLFIHACPAACCWMVRWRHTLWADCLDNNTFNLINLEQEEFSWDTVGEMVYKSFFVYIVWWVYYIIFNYGLCGSLMDNGWPCGAYDLKYSKGKSNTQRKLIYLAFHLCLFSVGTFFAIIVYWNIWVNSIYILMMYCSTFFNGGRYYVDYFAKAYDKKLKQTSLKQAEQKMQQKEKQ